MTDHSRARRWTLRPRSLQARFLAGTVLVLLVVMASVIVVVEQRQHAAIVGEVLRRGEVIAGDLAAMSSGPLLLYNFTALEQNVARVGANDDVVYAMVLDAEDRLHFREVRVLRTTQDEVVIGAGLAAGERVCTSPLETVVDGMRVRVAGQAEPAGANPS
mgnify:CR=1 FL=1